MESAFNNGINECEGLLYLQICFFISNLIPKFLSFFSLYFEHTHSSAKNVCMSTPWRRSESFDENLVFTLHHPLSQLHSPLHPHLVRVLELGAHFTRKVSLRVWVVQRGDWALTSLGLKLFGKIFENLVKLFTISMNL